jgi:hypothetical protein
MKHATLGLLLVLTWASGRADAAVFMMDKLETDDLRLLYFDPPQTYLTPHVARSFHNSLDFQKEVFGWEPWDKTTVLLKDFADYGNAAARSSPNNALMIDVAPLSRTYETFTASERIYTLMNHELVHVATMDVWNASDDRWRRFFGGKPMPEGDHPESILYNYLATPRVNVPRWYLEGSAVFMETWMGGGLGRAQGAYDEMVFRSMVRDEAHFYSALGLVSEGTAVDFQVGVNAYLYGTRFMSYMALEHTPQDVVEWLSRAEDSKRYYSRQFQKVFGLKLNEAWDNWIKWEHTFQRSNLEAVRQFPITPARPLADRALGSISRAYINEETGNLVGAFRYPGVLAHVGELNTANGDIRHLTDIKGPMLYKVTSLAYDPKQDKVWYTTDNYAFRDLVEVDVASGKSKMLLKDARIGEIVFNPMDNSLWGIRHLNGLATLVRLEAPYDKWTQVHTFDYGEVLYDMDISSDGVLLSTSMGAVSGDQSLRVYRLEDLLKGEVSAVQTFTMGKAIPEGFVFSPDNKFLFGSSYYTGVSNIFRFDVVKGGFEAVSNSDTGFFRPIPRADGTLVVFEYTGEGFRPMVIDPQPLEDVSAVRFLGTEVVKKHSVVKSWAVGSPVEVPLDDLVTKEGDYRPAREMRLGSAYPIVEGYQGYGAYGWHFNFEDPMQFHRLKITASYTPDEAVPSDERFHASVEYRGVGWYAKYKHNDADFYDLFGPKERSRKGDAVLIGYEKAIIYDKPRQLIFNADAAYYTGLDVLPGNQNVSVLDTDIATAELSLHYSHTRKSLGSVDHEKGLRWDASSSVSQAMDETLKDARVGIDYGVTLPWKHSSIWTYSSAGVSSGSLTNPLTGFYFGGFGNNFVDDGEVKRYREYNAMPGFNIDEIRAGDFAKTVVEWNLPPLRFRKMGTPGLYMSWARPAIFASGLIVEPGQRTQRTFLNAGAQIDFHFTLAHRLPMTLSVGYAAGFEDGDKLDSEAMVSLKIL